ncbi:extracellular solute-binding protein [Actinoallomurus spadix]|uniref:ABC transporter substrate-binding protein n=1 Tax=Actinoallomurus spadix TaxID=79912 RepID=A0ABP3GAL8_9ACTN|nr:extracellular solute-binding protein [Actinoallomurus spadix]MCO5989913.1 extracellular solute-binding protein [Actinoallomurus spadix]
MVSLSRTTLAGVGFASAIALAGCGSDGGASANPSGGPEKLTYVAYGGSGQDAQANAFQKPYTAAHSNVTFNNTSPADIAQVKAQVLSWNVQWDVVAVAPAAAKQHCGRLFEKLSLPKLNPQDFASKGVGECYVGNFANATPFAYNADKYPDPSKAPKTIQDFFDTTKFPGKRGVITNLQNGILEYPLLADGVTPDKLYPLDVDHSLRKWATIRKDTLFAPNVGALEQAVGSGQVDMFLLPDSRLYPLLNDKKNIKIVWGQTVVSINALAVPKGTKHKATAQDFLQFLAQPEQAAKVAEIMGVQPVNHNAKPQLAGNAKLVSVEGQGAAAKPVVQDVDWYAAHWDEVTTKLNNWLVG